MSRPSNLPADLDGIQIMAVDIIPSELPLDASAHFSNALMPYLNSLIRQWQGQEPIDAEDKLRLDALDRATIARHGKLAKKHEWLHTPLNTLLESKAEGLDAFDIDDAYNLATIKPKKTILLFGSGMVAKPAVTEFLKREDVNLVIGKKFSGRYLSLLLNSMLNSKQQHGGSRSIG